MTKFFWKTAILTLILNRKLIQAIAIPNITVMLYQNRLMNEVARAMANGKHVCRLREQTSAKMTRIEIPFSSCTRPIQVWTV